MRFDAPSNTPPPLAPSWRMILWAVTLVPALLILGWSLHQARSPKPDVVVANLTADEAQRLKRILNEPREKSATRLQDDSVRVVAASEPTKPDGNETSASQTKGDAQLDKAILVAIQDNTFGITAAEKRAYDAILAKARHTPADELERWAHKDVPFALLMLDADRYRGEILTIEGDIRRINPLADSFEAWLFTSDSGLNPYRVVLASLPDGFPRGDDLQPPVRARVTGYFFKRFSYATENGFHTAPLLLANTLVPSANSKSTVIPARKNSRSLTILAIGILGTLVISGLAVELIARRHSRRRRHRVAEANDPPPDFSGVKHS